jgi:hypothetical protein
MKKLPIKEFKIDEKTGAWVSGIAITTTPAIQSNFITFSTQEKQKFTEIPERKELLGIAMKAGDRIYRNSEEFGEYECFFSADTIRLISQIFFKRNFANNLNIEHTDVSAGSTTFQSFIVDSSIDVNSPKGLNAKDGDWIIGVKCWDDDVFKVLKETGAGFSVEGIFDMIESEFKSEEENVLKGYLNALNTLLKTP